MKKLFLILFVFTYSTFYAQEKPVAEMHFIESSVKSLKFSVDSPEEFKTINWKDIKDIFSENKKTDTISIGFELNKNAKNKQQYSFTIKGISENVDGLISLSKKAIKTLNKL
ncbi:hypothetical protein [uncultured Polaribacter sp.]|uniref:hypothetical protein n=1 Tax=uncultured Polaribacter sp. TaxID=174711 RepID=UPI00260959B1|nr:hypothetical protein [uncultured Polaribacter sp.]